MNRNETSEMIFVKNHFLQIWKEKLISSHDKELHSPLKVLAVSSTDHFLNPAGAIINKTLETLFNEITGAGDMDEDAVLSALNDFVHLMAVQEGSPSQCADFLFILKRIIRDGSDLDNGINIERKNIIDDRIDSVVLKFFDIFMKCREEIYNIRIVEYKKKAFRAMENVQ